MGVSIEQWRCRIGCFTHPKSKISTTMGCRGIKPGPTSLSLAIKIVLFLLLTVEGIELNPGPTTRGNNSRQNNDKIVTRRGGSGRGCKWARVPNPDTIDNSMDNSNPNANISNQTSRGVIDQPSIQDWFISTQQSSNQSQSLQKDKRKSKRSARSESGDSTQESDSEDDFQTSDETNITGASNTNTSTNVPLSILLDIQKSVNRLDKKFEKMEKSISGLKRENKELRKKNEELTDNVKELRNHVSDLSKQNKELFNKYENLEGHSRRQNLKFYNIQEDKGETWDETERKVRNYVQNELGLDCAEINIERAHRLQAKFKPRPVIVKFSFYKDKERIFQKYRHLMKSLRDQNPEGASDRLSIRISEDFPERVRRERALLYPFMKQAIESGKKTHLRYNKLCIDGETFVYDESSKSPVPVFNRD